MQRLKEIIASQLNIPLSNVDNKSTLTSLGADSLDAVEIVMELEGEFGRYDTDGKFESAEITVGDLINFFAPMWKIEYEIPPLRAIYFAEAGDCTEEELRKGVALNNPNWKIRKLTRIHE